MRFVKKPIVVEAFRWAGGEDMTDLPEWFRDGMAGGVVAFCTMFGVRNISFEVSGGTVYAAPGDWVIRGVEGEIYPCQPSVFEATYSPEGAAP